MFSVETLWDAEGGRQEQGPGRTAVRAGVQGVAPGSGSGDAAAGRAQARDMREAEVIEGL